MTECIIEEFNSGKDQCLEKVLSYLEGKSAQYYQKLYNVFGSSEYFKEFEKCYMKSEVSEVNGLGPGELSNSFVYAYVLTST